MAQGNAQAARRIYRERYPQRAVPAVRTFIRIHARLSETGSFKRSTVVIGRPAIVRTVQMEEAVLNEIERNPETSTRKIAHELNITHVMVWQILRHEQLYPYHFCNWLRNQILRNPKFRYCLLTKLVFFGMPLSIIITITYGLRIIHTPS
nr:unnamed protein product [Callosobruchus chinensis]